MDHDHHDHHDHDHHDHHHHDHAGMDAAEAGAWMPDVWLQALASTAFIGIAPVLLLVFLPLKSSKGVVNQSLLRVLLGFAVGGLLGDVFLHLIPHSLMHASESSSDHGHDHGHDHHHHHEHEHEHGHAHGEHGHSHTGPEFWMGLWILAGLFVFFLTERILVGLLGGSHGHSHAHGHGKADKAEVVGGGGEGDGKGARKRKPVGGAAGGAAGGTASDSAAVPDPETHKLMFGVSGYLNLAADFMHNFTDGLAVGASFLASPRMGLVTTVAILLHELPHEVGDLAILIQAGFSQRSALLVQLLTALGAMAGTIVSLLFSSSHFNTSWVLCFTAGGFIYIALTTVTPELLLPQPFFQTVLEVAAMVLGVALMAMIAIFE